MSTFNKAICVNPENVIHCTCPNEAIALLMWANKIGLKWSSDKTYKKDQTQWDIYEKETCYYLTDGMFGTKMTYEGMSLNILEFKDVLNAKV